MPHQEYRLTKLSSRLLPSYVSCWALDYGASSRPEDQWRKTAQQIKHLEWPDGPLGASWRDLKDLLASPYADEVRTTILVTGFRGAGKTSLVEKALFEAARERWKRRNHREQKPSLVLFLTIRISVPRPIREEDLLRRTVRMLYRSMVDHGVGDIAPDAMLEARVAYLRTLGTLKTKETSEQRLKTTSQLGFSLEKLKEIKLSAEEEWKVAKSLEMTFGRSSAEEAEDDLAAISANLVQTTGPESIIGRSLSNLAGLKDAIKKHIKGNEVEIRPVFIFDELDKLVDPQEVGKPEPCVEAEEPPRLCRVVDVVTTLKTVFSTTKGTFIFVTGVREELEWLRALGTPNELYPSLFGRRIYAGLVREPETLWHIVDTLAGSRREDLRDDSEALNRLKISKKDFRYELGEMKKALVILSGGVVRSALRFVAEDVATFDKRHIWFRSEERLER